MEQSLGMVLTIVLTSVLIIGLSQALSVISQASEKDSTTESKLPKNDINNSILGSDAPTLNLKKNIKITVDKFNESNSLEDNLNVVKQNSNCSAVDYEGNTISSDNIKVELDKDDSSTLNNYIRKGGVIRVKYSVEDSKGRKTSIIKNVILRLVGGGVSS